MGTKRFNGSDTSDWSPNPADQADGKPPFIVRGVEKGGVSNLTAVPIFVVWLYATLVLAERRSGYVIILIGSLLRLGVPVIHMMGKGVGVEGPIAKSSGAFFFV